MRWPIGDVLPQCGSGCVVVLLNDAPISSSIPLQRWLWAHNRTVSSTRCGINVHFSLISDSTFLTLSFCLPTCFEVCRLLPYSLVISGMTDAIIGILALNFCKDALITIRSVTFHHGDVSGVSIQSKYVTCPRLEDLI